MRAMREIISRLRCGKIHPATFACVLGALLLAGCGGSKQKTSSGHPLPQSHLVSKCEPGKAGGQFVLVASASPRTFNPLFVDGPADCVTRLLFSSLVNIDPLTQEATPGLAESWSVASDQKTWTLKLRPGVRWSDGLLLTADDVVFTWNRIMYNPEWNRASYEMFRLNGKNFEVSNPDSFTVRVVTPEVFAPFVEYFGSAVILPRHVLESSVQQRTFPSAYAPNTPPKYLVGSGPYRLKEFKAGQYTLLERNPEYWVTDSKGQRLPYFGEVMVKVQQPGFGSEANAPLASVTAAADACDNISPAIVAQFKDAAGAGKFRVHELGVGGERDFFWFNQNTLANSQGKPIVTPAKLKWFRNRKFREACSCALDRERMAREAYGGMAQPMYNLLSTENPKWNNPKVSRYSYDPAKAAALLAEAGFTGRNEEGILKDAEGNPAEIVFCFNTGNALREKAAAMIIEDLRKVGVRLIPNPVEFPMLVQKISETGDYECALMGLGGGGVDPASQMNVLKSSEDLHQWFPRQPKPSSDWEARVDELMDAQMRTLDFAQRKKAFDEVQAILAEEVPMIYTVSPISYAAIKEDVSNVRPSVLSPYRVTWNLEELFRK